MRKIMRTVSFTLMAVVILSLLALVSCDIDGDFHTHSFGEWTVAEEATCTEAGNRVRGCSCGETETEVISATGHDLYYCEKNDEGGNTTSFLSCQNEGCKTIQENIFGLYNAAGKRLASWDELVNVYGLDIGKAFSQKSLEIDEALLQNIIKNNSKLQEGTRLIVSDSVNRIGNFALFGCSSLTSIVVPSNVTYLGYNAFYGCNFEMLYTGTAEEWANAERSQYMMGSGVLIRYEDKMEFMIRNFVPNFGNSVGSYGQLFVKVDNEQIYIGNSLNTNLYYCVQYDESFELEYNELETLAHPLISESERQEMSAILDKIKGSDTWYMLRKYENGTYTNKYLVCMVDEAYYFIPITQSAENENSFSAKITSICRHDFGGYIDEKG